ncbi:MAG: peptidylprolyl isomerase [candidate division Zixibacteria bacterium]|nr:peptidylprolyl isomerase [candidate division Zixibacteria bacterium]
MRSFNIASLPATTYLAAPSMEPRVKRVLAVAGILFLAVAVYFIYSSLKPKTRPEKLAEIIHLEDCRLVSSALIKYLQDDSPEIRARAALAIGRIGTPRTAEHLYQMLKDPSLDVAATAAFALGLTGDHSFARKLLDNAVDLPTSVAAWAVRSGGRLVDSTMTDAGPAIASYLLHPAPEVREAACYALFYAKAKDAAAELTSFVKTESDSAARSAGLFTLARLGLDAGTPVFVDYLADSDPYLRALAVRGLASSKSPEAEHYLEIALNDADKNVVAQVINSLGSHKTPSAAQRLGQRLTRETDEKLMLELFAALRKLNSDQGLSVARAHLATGSSANIIAAALPYLVSIEKDQAMLLIDSLMNGKPEAKIRAACAEAYGLQSKVSVIPRLAGIFADEDPDVRAAAFEQLWKLDTVNRAFYLNKALADPDYMLVVTAIDKIGGDTLHNYLPKLRELIAKGASVDIDIRRSVVSALKSFIVPGLRDTAVMDILIAAALDPEYVVRRDAVDIYQEQFNEDHWKIVSPAATRFTERQIKAAIDKYTENPLVTILTSKGEMEIELFFDTAPLTVLNFIELATNGFYDGLSFHRVVPNFVIQGGDPRGDGWGGPEYFIRCEYSNEKYLRGTVGIATSGKDTGGSQFFITLSPQPHLDSRYTVFGQVKTGMATADAIGKGDVIQKIIIQERKS